MLDLSQLANIASHIIATASLITAFTQTPPSDTIIGKIYKLIEYIALVTEKTKGK